MHSMIDFATLDLRDAYDFAIMIEEDAQLRYRQLAGLLGDDPGGAGDVCRLMVATENQHRRALVARRASLFRDAPPRLEISVLEDGIDRPEVEDDELPTTARDALQLAIAAEWRAHAFFAWAIQHVADPDTCAFFQQLMEEEVEHAHYLALRIAELPGSRLELGAPLRPGAAPRASAPMAPYPDRVQLEEVLPRFDAATRAIAGGVLVAGLEPREVARTLGVSGRTVARKLARFVALARQEVAVAEAAVS